MATVTNIRAFGFTIRIEMLIAILIVGAVIFMFSLGSCSRFPIAETFSTLGGLGAELKYTMPNVATPTGAWNTSRDYPKYTAQLGAGKILPEAQMSAMVQPDQSMFFYGATQFSPKCCGSSASTSQGCSCLNQDQKAYLGSRGGNATTGGDY